MLLIVENSQSYATSLPMGLVFGIYIAPRDPKKISSMVGCILSEQASPPWKHSSCSVCSICPLPPCVSESQWRFAHRWSPLVSQSPNRVCLLCPPTMAVISSSCSASLRGVVRDNISRQCMPHVIIWFLILQFPLFECTTSGVSSYTGMTASH